MYETLYKEFNNEIHTVLSSYYLWKKINDSTTDENTLKAFNRTPRSWLIIRHSLQVTFMITLHRIFQTGKEHASAETLLHTCKKNIELFSVENYKKRKDPENKNPPWLEENVAKAYMPTPNDFELLSGELKKHRNIFNKIYRPIRNKLIAHNLLDYMGKSKEMYGKTNIKELEEMLGFLNSLKEALFELYENGYKPDISSHKLDISHYEKDYDTLINAIKSV